jgi:tyrosyl-tRNA synthetase
MSKSEGNYIGVSEPPEEIFGKTMSVPDSAMPAYYALLLDRDPDPALPPVDAKRALARELTARFAGEEAAREAEARFDRVHVRHDVPEEIEEHRLPPGEDPVHLPALLAEAFGISRSEARRLLGQGGVKLDGEPLSDADLDLPAERLDGRVVQVGRRRFARFRLAP